VCCGPQHARAAPARHSGHSGTVFACPVCGAEELTAKPYETWPPPDGVALAPPYEDHLGPPSYEVCPNCGFEFGNDDNPGTAPPCSFEDYRRGWEEGGSPRFGPRA
jgi:predicted RNA-binding Zn-ribbon protein involved in translation (DUF1610 family)